MYIYIDRYTYTYMYICTYIIYIYRCIHRCIYIYSHIYGYIPKPQLGGLETVGLQVMSLFLSVILPLKLAHVKARLWP